MASSRTRLVAAFLSLAWAAAETLNAYGLLFERLNDQGLEEVPLIVANG